MTRTPTDQNLREAKLDRVRYTTTCSNGLRNSYSFQPCDSVHRVPPCIQDQAPYALGSVLELVRKKGIKLVWTRMFGAMPRLLCQCTGTPGAHLGRSNLSPSLGGRM